MVLSKVRRLLWCLCALLIFGGATSNMLPQEGKHFTPMRASAPAYQLPAKVILGGDAVGFEYQTDGVLVLSKSKIATLEGYVETEGDLRAGDIICGIGEEKVSSADQLGQEINSPENQNKLLTLKIVRKNKEITSAVKPTFDLFAKKYKLGVWVKDSASGVGTVTYIDPETGRFGALGHPITEGFTQQVMPVGKGKVYNCNIIGVSRATRGVPGELRGIIQKNKPLGEVSLNNNFGVYGTMAKEMLENKQERLIEVGGRAKVKPGKAKIYSSVDGEHIRACDIEIIKTNYQSISDEKSLVFKVTDNELIRQTGGILQGMSGSPIVQDGKLVGAVTHVFLNDPTKGFGLYIDWMLAQN